MAVTPQQAERLHPAEKAQARKLEAMIDNFLIHAPKNSAGNREYDLPAGITAKVVNNVIGDYKAVGWNVEHEYGIGFIHKDKLYFKPEEPANLVIVGN
jgi:hypothetical protein